MLANPLRHHLTITEEQIITSSSVIWLMKCSLKTSCVSCILNCKFSKWRHMDFTLFQEYVFYLLSFLLKSIYLLIIYHSRQKIWDKIRKSNKLDWTRKCLCLFRYFLVFFVKVFFLKGRLGTRLCLILSVRFF